MAEIGWLWTAQTLPLGGCPCAAPSGLCVDPFRPRSPPSPFVSARQVTEGNRAQQRQRLLSLSQQQCTALHVPVLCCCAVQWICLPPSVLYCPAGASELCVLISSNDKGGAHPTPLQRRCVGAPSPARLLRPSSITLSSPSSLPVALRTNSLPHPHALRKRAWSVGGFSSPLST